MGRFTIAGYYHHLLFISLIILLAMAKSISHARQVKEVKVIAADEEEKNLYIFHKEDFSHRVQNHASPARTFATIGGNTVEEELKTRKTDKNGMILAAPSPGDNRKEKWKEYFRAFREDYRPPKPHPPKNN